MVKIATRQPEGELQTLWWSRLAVDIGPDEAGWWIVYCPKHDEGTEEQRSAQINFDTKRWKCQHCTPGSVERQDRSIALREPTAWLQGFASHADLRAARREANKTVKVDKWAAADAIIESMRASYPDLSDDFIPRRPWAVFMSPLLIAPTDKMFVARAGWWDGWCPLHDHDRDRKKPTAVYQPSGGNYKCLADPPCHAPKKAMSLLNLKSRVEAEGA